VWWLHQVSASPEVREEMFCHSIETAMNYGRLKSREKESNFEVLDEKVVV
jgi:hypothetical protein